MKYTPIIGLEVHVELSTLSKMFCGCNAEHFNIKPNTHTCPICLGLPGALPVPNKKAINWTILIGLALSCRINKLSKFDRKHYFYPDLPKGYQISQYDQPLAINGSLELKMLNDKLQMEKKTVKITRVHLEEDTGKLIHAKVKGKNVSLVDFNRSGVPLVEIVTEPDIHSSEDAKVFVKSIQQIVRYLGVSDCDMEKGSMRLEANISLTSDDSLPSYKVEVKNLNSFRFLKEAIDYEIARQARILDSGKHPIQETRGWHEDKRKTLAQRSKEEAQDYRYFPEPDIPPLVFDDEDISATKKTLPELPQRKLARFIKNYQIKPESAQTLIASVETANYFEEVVKQAKKHHLKPQELANILINKKINTTKISPNKFVQSILAKAQSQVTDSKTLQSWVSQAVAANPQAVVDYKSGKTQVLGFLLGQIQKLAHGKADAKKTSQLLKQALSH